MNRVLTGRFRLSLLLVMAFFSQQAQAAESENNHHRILVVYFSQPENVSLDGVDAVSGASILEKNGERSGSTQYIAKLIQQQTGADLFRIETVQPYPTQHAPLLEYAEQEQKAGARPVLKSKIENLAAVETIFIGYPIWWYKMPMVMYSFFEQYDLSGKTLIPFTTHGGSRFSDSLREIKRLQPNAKLISKGLAISRDDVADDDIPEEVIDWIKQLPDIN